MDISRTVKMVKSADNTRLVIKVENKGTKELRYNSETQNWFELYDKLRYTEISMREAVMVSEINNGKVNLDSLFGNCSSSEETVIISEKEYLVRGLKGLINFFKEFEFEPNFRFVNTIAFKLMESEKSAKDYIYNYFALMDNSYLNEIKNKMKSAEFGQILSDIKNGGTPNSEVNTRFKIYYGSAGTGKTTLAQKESNGRCVVCNASMLPSDLMEDFVFSNGQPSFKKSSLWECMEIGTKIVLDEINLLPFDSLRFLQGILDGKKEFDYKGNKVTIADGFQIIGTMNLSIGGMVYGLPEPLVDRTKEIKKFTLTAEMLANSVLG